MKKKGQAILMTMTLVIEKVDQKIKE